MAVKTGKTKRVVKKRTAKKSVKRKPVAKKRRPTALSRPEKNPIISPRPDHDWEAWQTFNPGVILLDDRVHFLYRALGSDGVSRLGYAVSDDGFNISKRLSYPVYEHQENKKQAEHIFRIFSYFSGGSWGGAEDPRLVQVEGEDIIYLTYTACDNGLRVGLSAIKVADFLNKKWHWKEPVLISSPQEVNKNWVIFPEKINGRYAILHSLKPTVQIEYLDNLNFDNDDYIKSSDYTHLGCYGTKPRKNGWDKWVRGAGAPPLKTRAGWLLFYHAMDNDWGKYKVGALLLDLKDPTKILARAKEPILEPDKDYENNGFKSGIVFVSGAVIKDEKLLVYYGCSDSYVGVAYANLEEFLTALEKDTEPKLKLKRLGKK
ncbi:MAG: glycosidase [Candidatus Paceibacterota bacterium]